jgi:hypothetical protein
MDKASEAILALKPVTFKYNSDKKGRTQYGLIAEEVAEVASDLVFHHNNGEIATVRFEQIGSMLLNEFLKAQKSAGLGSDCCEAAERDGGFDSAAQRAGRANPKGECPARSEQTGGKGRREQT